MVFRREGAKVKRRVALLLVVGVTALFGLGLSHADEPSQACSDTSTPVSADPLANGARVCVNAGAGLDGSATVAGDPTTQTGYAVVDGNSTNQDPADGYLGVESGNPNDAGGNPAIVGCNDGNYDPSGANNVIIAADGTVNPPPNDCTPPLPSP